MTLQDFLASKAIQHEEIKLTMPVHSAKDVQAICDCQLSEVLKALVFVADNKGVLAVISGNRKADTGKLKNAINAENIRMAKPDEVYKLTGCRVGTVSPFNVPNCLVI